MNCRRLLLLAVTMVVVVGIVASCARSTGPQSAVTVLVDLSRTWHRPDLSKRTGELLADVNRAVFDLAQELPPPVEIRFSPITGDSLSEQPLCFAEYARSITGANEQANRLQNPKKLTSFLAGCAQLVQSRKGADYTDISGALDAIRRQISHPGITRRKLIVLSDMKEERRPGYAMPEFRLDGYDIVLFYRVLPEDNQSPKALDERIASWQQRLTRLGASSVNVLSDAAPRASQIAGFLR